MILGLAGALVAAVCYGFGSILQALAAADAPTTERLEAMVLARLVAQWRYVAGLGLDLVGFLAALVALRTLPLFVVQAAVASSVGVTALAAGRLLHTRLDRTEQRALAALLIGLLLLAASGRPERAAALTEPGPALLLGGAVALGLLAVLLTHSSSERTGVVLAAGAGASFGAVGIAARAFRVPHHLLDALRDPLFAAIVAHGGLALVLFAGALQRARVTIVAAVTFAVETVVPAIVGVVWLGDRARSGMAPEAVLGFTLTVGASVALARFAEVGEATPDAGRPSS